MRDTTAVCDTLCHGVSSGDGILYHPRTDESTHIPSTSTDSIPTPRQHDAAPTPHCMPRGDTEAWASCDAEELRGDFNHRDGSHNEREETAPHCVSRVCASVGFTLIDALHVARLWASGRAPVPILCAARLLPSLSPPNRHLAT